MIRIKDGVELEELNKYGFDHRYNTYTGKIDRYVCEGLYLGKCETFIEIEKSYKGKKEIWIIYIRKTGEKAYDTLFDLITAGIVVKE